jgi:hypothetical protein
VAMIIIIVFFFFLRICETAGSDCFFSYENTVKRDDAVSYIPLKVPGPRSYEGKIIRDYTSAFVG